MNEKIINLVNNAANAADKHAAINKALETIRKDHKLDLWDVVRYETREKKDGVFIKTEKIDFIYIVEDLKEPIYITGTALKTPRIWIDIEYF